jgi:hypothetical protein
VTLRARWVTLYKSSLGDAESSLGDATSSLGDAKSSLGDAKSSLGDAESSLHPMASLCSVAGAVQRGHDGGQEGRVLGAG